MYIGFGNGIGRSGLGGAGYDAMASAYFAAVPNSFDAARKTIINTLIAGLRADGNLTKLDRLWLFANTTTGNAVIDVIGLNSATLVNAPTFTVDQGYAGNGTTSYVNSNFTPSTQGVNYTQNSATMSVYNRTSGVLLDNVEMGTSNAAGLNRSLLEIKYTDDNFYAACNGVTVIGAANGDPLGLSSVTRTASGVAGALKIYNDSSEIGSGSSTSEGLSSVPFFIGAENINGTATYFSSRQLSVALMGSGAVNISALYTRIQTYMTSLGTQV